MNTNFSSAFNAHLTFGMPRKKPLGPKKGNTSPKPEANKESISSNKQLGANEESKPPEKRFDWSIPHNSNALKPELGQRATDMYDDFFRKVVQESSHPTKKKAPKVSRATKTASNKPKQLHPLQKDLRLKYSEWWKNPNSETQAAYLSAAKAISDKRKPTGIVSSYYSIKGYQTRYPLKSELLEESRKHNYSPGHSRGTSPAKREASPKPTNNELQALESQLRTITSGKFSPEKYTQALELFEQITAIKKADKGSQKSLFKPPTHEEEVQLLMKNLNLSKEEASIRLSSVKKITGSLQSSDLLQRADAEQKFDQLFNKHGAQVAGQILRGFLQSGKSSE